jgi:NTP pyrophosphatase (non-canonical NTP hydrolase)
MQGITIRYLQEYIRSKNINLENKEALFLKLSEEVGELAEAMLRNPEKATETSIKGTIEEEICDVISLCVIIANSYDIDIEKWIPIKEKLHNEKWKNNVVFDPH